MAEVESVEVADSNDRSVWIRRPLLEPAKYLHRWSKPQ